MKIKALTSIGCSVSSSVSSWGTFTFIRSRTTVRRGHSVLFAIRYAIGSTCSLRYLVRYNWPILGQFTRLSRPVVRPLPANCIHPPALFSNTFRSSSSSSSSTSKSSSRTRRRIARLGAFSSCSLTVHRSGNRSQKPALHCTAGGGGGATALQQSTCLRPPKTN